MSWWSKNDPTDSIKKFSGLDILEKGIDQLTGKAGERAADEAAQAAIAGDELAMSEFRAAEERARADRQPFTDIGISAGEMLKKLMGDDGQAELDFRRQQGFEDIQESAAARGRLGAGGTLRDLTSFNTDLTSTLQNQRFNQLFNVLGLGANSASGQATGALQTGANIGGLQSGIGTTRGNAIIGGQNARNQGFSNIASLAGTIFGGPVGGAAAGGLTQGTANQIAAHQF